MAALSNCVVRIFKRDLVVKLFLMIVMVPDLVDLSRQSRAALFVTVLACEYWKCYWS